MCIPIYIYIYICIYIYIYIHAATHHDVVVALVVVGLHLPVDVVGLVCTYISYTCVCVYIHIYSLYIVTCVVFTCHKYVYMCMYTL